MIEKQNPRFLKRRLSYSGPFILYFSTGKEGPNSQLKSKMNILDSKYEHLVILEVDWDEYKKIRNKLSFKIENNIYLFCKGKQIKCVTYPDKTGLAELFREGIKIHNEKIENSCKMLGTKPPKNVIISDPKYDHTKKIYSQRRRNIVLAANKKFRMNKIINLPDIEDITRDLDSDICLKTETSSKFNKDHDTVKSLTDPLKNNLEEINKKKILRKRNLLWSKYGNISRNISNYKKYSIPESNSSEVVKPKMNRANYLSRTNKTNINFQQNTLDLKSKNSRKKLPFKWVVHGKQILSKHDYFLLVNERKLISPNSEIKNNIEIKDKKCISENIITTNIDLPMDLSIKKSC